MSLGSTTLLNLEHRLSYLLLYNNMNDIKFKTNYISSFNAFTHTHLLLNLNGHGHSSTTHFCQHNKKKDVVFLACFAAFGGFMFGYDIG